MYGEIKLIVQCAKPNVYMLFVVEEMLTWTNLFDDGDRGHGVSMGIAMLLFICNCVIHYLITMYIDAIKPGSYGIAKPWYFMFEVRHVSVFV